MILFLFSLSYLYKEEEAKFLVVKELLGFLGKRRGGGGVVVGLHLRQPTCPLSLHPGESHWLALLGATEARPPLATHDPLSLSLALSLSLSALAPPIIISDGRARRAPAAMMRKSCCFSLLLLSCCSLVS